MAESEYFKICNIWSFELFIY